MTCCICGRFSWFEASGPLILNLLLDVNKLSVKGNCTICVNMPVFAVSRCWTWIFFGCKWSSPQIVIDIMLFMKCRWNVDRWPHLYLPSMMDDRSSTLVAKDLRRLDLDLQRKTACVELDTCGFVWGHEETSTCVYGWFEEGEVPAALQGVAELVVLVVLDGDLFPLLLLLLLWLTFSTSNPDWGVPNRNSQLGSALTQRKTTWIHATADSRRRNRTIFLKAKHLTEAALWLLNEYPDRRFFNTFAVTWLTTCFA